PTRGSLDEEDLRTMGSLDSYDGSLFCQDIWNCWASRGDFDVVVRDHLSEHRPDNYNEYIQNQSGGAPWAS
ncbi:MAG: hypothetical protein ACYDBP_14800, partial [Leptospirales bacterium]